MINRTLSINANILANTLPKSMEVYEAYDCISGLMRHLTELRCDPSVCERVKLELFDEVNSVFLATFLNEIEKAKCNKKTNR